MKGILTDCHTGVAQEIEIEYKIVEIEGKKIFQLVNGPTGYESFYIDSEYNHLDNVCENGWTACIGTAGIGIACVWDKLFIPAEEMKEALKPFIGD